MKSKSSVSSRKSAKKNAANRSTGIRSSKSAKGGAVSRVGKAIGKVKTENIVSKSLLRSAHASPQQPSPKSIQKKVRTSVFHASGHGEIAPIRSTPIDFVQTMIDRGFLFQATDEGGLRRYMTDELPTAYIGFDCTAPSLHVGSLVQIMMLRWFQKAGGRPIVLLGTGTTRIGDPSGKDTQRPLLHPQTIQQFKRKIGGVFARFLDFQCARNPAVMVDNSAWLQKKRLGLIEFLEIVGRHYTINKLITLESMQRRLDRQQPLTFLEFNYPLLQAFDFLHLSRPPFDCHLQMGGSDQWGNIVQGIELSRRVDGTECFGLTSPLITTSSGAKMGKTAEGAVWLSAEYKSPYEYWQFWRNTEDADVGRFLRLFTELPLSQIAQLEARTGAGINEAKKVLATEATALLHGREEALKAEQTARATFEEGSLGEDLPTFVVTSSEFQLGLRVSHALALAKLVTSNGEGKRAIANNAASVNNAIVQSETATLGNADIVDGVIKLSFGKKKHALLRVQ